MTENNVKYKVLISLIYHYMERGLEMYRDVTCRDMCLVSAGLYLVMLGLPGSGAFKIFHPVLFSKALECFNLVEKLKLNAQEPKKGRKGTSQSQSQSQSQRRRRTSASSTQTQVLNHLSFIAFICHQLFYIG